MVARPNRYFVTQYQLVVVSVDTIDQLRPQGSGSDGRPKTTAMVARRMVSSALGIKVKLSHEQKEREMRELDDARGQSRLIPSPMIY